LTYVEVDVREGFDFVGFIFDVCNHRQPEAELTNFNCAFIDIDSVQVVQDHCALRVQRRPTLSFVDLLQFIPGTRVQFPAFAFLFELLEVLDALHVDVQKHVLCSEQERTTADRRIKDVRFLEDIVVQRFDVVRLHVLSGDLAGHRSAIRDRLFTTAGFYTRESEHVVNFVVFGINSVVELIKQVRVDCPA